MKKEDILKEGVFIPNEEELENCMKGKACEYGICDECSVNCREEEDEEK